VLRFCLTFPAIGEADAGDLTQEVFVRAFRSIGGLKEPERFEGWLFAIARNRCLTLLRRAHRARIQGDQLAREAAAAPAAGDEERLARERETAVVAEEIARLPDSPQKEAGRLYYQEGRDTKAIAAALGAPVSTITTWLSRFRVRIRKRLVLRILALRGSGME
jgi:RNA polymerase sigma-70 factor (ECF subfamily)